MKRALVLAALLLCAQAVRAAEPSTAEAAKPDTAKGQAIVAKVCVACHGPDGKSRPATSRRSAPAR